MFTISQLSARSSVSMADTNLLNEIEAQSQRDPYVEGNLKLLHTVPCIREVMCVRFSPDGQHLAIGLANGTIQICSPDTGQVHHTLKDSDLLDKRLPVTSIKFVPVQPEDIKVEHKHIIMATYASGHIKFWYFPTASCLGAPIDEDRQTLASAFNPDGTMFITSGADPQLRKYDLETRKLVGTMEGSDSRDLMNGHRARVFALQYHQNEPHTFVSGGWDDTIQFWDDRMKHSVRKLFGPHICGDSIDIDPIHNHLLTGSWRKHSVLQIWDFQTGEKIKDVPQDHLHGSLLEEEPKLYCAQWLGKEHIICGGCEHNMARVIDRGTLNTVGQLVDLPQGVFCLDHDRSAPRPIIAIGSANRVYILRLEKRN